MEASEMGLSSFSVLLLSTLEFKLLSNSFYKQHCLEMCCYLILFHPKQLGGPVPTYSQEVEPEHLFTLRLLEARLFSRVFLQ